MTEDNGRRRALPQEEPMTLSMPESASTEESEVSARTGVEPKPISVSVNRLAERQPFIPDIFPDLHLNLLISGMARGGAERAVSDILIGLENRDPTIKLFLEENASPCYPVEETPRRRIYRLSGLSESERIRKIACEAMASPSRLIYAFEIGANRLRGLWDMGILTVPVIRNSEPSWQDPPQAYDHPNVPFVVATSEHVADQLRRAGCPKPVIAQRHQAQRWFSVDEIMANRAEIRAKHEIRPTTLLIGMVGAFKTHRAYTRAARVLRAARERRDAKLMILGSWNHDGGGRDCYNAVCRLALELGVMPDLITPGSVQRIEPYFAAFDVFLNTSVYEGLSVALLEAIQAGCPIVCADAGGNREALPPSAILIDDGTDIDAYDSAIEAVIRRPTREIPLKPPDAGLVPQMWCLLGRYGAPNENPPERERKGTLFITENINFGGPQRSLINLLSRLAPIHPSYLFISDGVYCSDYLEPAEAAGAIPFTLDKRLEVGDRVERLLYMAERLRVRNICFWNADCRYKMLIAKTLLLRDIRLVDVSPGPMLFTEMDSSAEFGRLITFSSEDYLRRLNAFVTKYAGGGPDSTDPAIQAKVVVIPNGVPMEPPPIGEENPLALSPGENPDYAIGVCCRIAPAKRLEDLVEMMKILTPLAPGVSLTIVGGVDPRHEGYLNEIIDRIEESGFTNIHFADGRADVRPYLRAFKVFVMVSDDQGCPNASLEAMAEGLPIVANASGGTAEQVEHDINGFLVEDGEPEELAARVACLLQRPELRAAFGKAGCDKARDRFSMDRMVKAYLDILA